MKNLNAVLVSVFLPLLMIGCEGNGRNGGKKVRNHGGISRELRGNIETSAANQENIAWGQIYDYNHTYSVPSFQERVEDFLSPQLDADEIGEVNGNFGSIDTGIFFFGRGIKFSSQPQKDNNGYVREINVFSTSSSELRIEVEDRYNGDRSIIPLHFNENGNGPGGLTGSLVSGEFIQLIFEDEFGKVSLEGVIKQFSNGDVLYQGDVWYKNLARIREGQSLQILSQNERFLGGFTINACNFFDVSQILSYRCNN